MSHLRDSSFTAKCADAWSSPFLLILKSQSLSTGSEESSRTHGGAGLPFPSGEILTLFPSCHPAWQEKLGAHQKEEHGLWERAADFSAESCSLMILPQKVGW